MWSQIRQWAQTIKRDAFALWFAIRDPRAPRWLRWAGFLIIAYALSPIDLIPDFLPVIGYLDELIILPAGLWLMLRFMPPAVLSEARLRADDWIAAGNARPRSVLGAVIVIIVWVTIAWWLVALFSSPAIAGRA